MKSKTQLTAFLLLTLWSISSAIGQDMNVGFRQLENGEFNEAKIFFQKVLVDYPSNMTAQICHARALGLSGNASEALETFQTLNQKEPGNTEILLNLAEAHLWDKNGEAALNHYLDIHAENPQMFVAILGTANAYSMTQDYENAHNYIQQAVALEPQNGQAKISKKYIQLAYANQLASQKQAYDQALLLIEDNLNSNSKDQESLELKANILMQSKSFEAAIESFKALDQPVSSLIGQSIAHHFLNDDDKALELAASAVEKATKKSEKIKANSHFNQALLWKGNLKEAKTHFESLNKMGFSSKDLLLVNANLALNEADFSQAVQAFKSYLQQDTNSFNANLGLANAMHALNMDQNAYKYAFLTEGYYPGQKDARSFINKLNANHNAILKSVYQYELSSDGSYNKRWTVGSSFALSPLTSMSVEYNKSTLSSKNQQSNLDDQRIGLLAKHQINKTIGVTASYRFISIQAAAEQNAINKTEMEVNVAARLNKKQTLTVGVSTEVQDFNASLLKQNISNKNLFLKNSLFWKQANFGVYSELFVSQISDGNSRLLSFNSVYKNIASNPALKVGINHLMIKFNENTTAYFSPQSYQQFELFGSLNKSMNEKSPWTYGLDLAFGYQFSDGMQQLTWRTKSTLERKIRKIKVGVSIAYSSIAAVNNNGFSYLNTSAQVIIPLTKRPIFYNKLRKSLGIK